MDRMVYFAEDGSYGSANNIICIKEEDLTSEQWDEVENASDMERYSVVAQIVIDKLRLT
jgi:hypothetical protein